MMIIIKSLFSRPLFHSPTVRYLHTVLLFIIPRILFLFLSFYHSLFLSSFSSSMARRSAVNYAITLVKKISPLGAFINSRLYVSLPPSLPPLSLSLSLTLYFSLLYCVSRWISLLLALSRFYCSTLSVIFMHACMHEYPRMNSFIIIRTNHHWIIFNQPQLTIKLVISRREINALFFLFSLF